MNLLCFDIFLLFMIFYMFQQISYVSETYV
jgi:hypothetical protein